MENMEILSAPYISSLGGIFQVLKVVDLCRCLIVRKNGKPFFCRFYVTDSRLNSSENERRRKINFFLSKPVKRIIEKSWKSCKDLVYLLHEISNFNIFKKISKAFSISLKNMSYKGFFFIFHNDYG